MSKIDAYNEAKRKAEDMREFADAVADSKHADKFGMKFRIEETWLGYYGNSSSYGWNDHRVSAVAHQIELELRNIVQHAADRIEFEAEQAAIAAVDEARAVLGAIGTKA